MSKIPTKDSNGKPNGYVLPIWSALEDPQLRPEQVYLTAVAPRSRKGPHLHMKRRGLFQVLVGEVSFRVRLPDGEYRDVTFAAGESRAFVPPGIPCALYNWGDEPALVLNLPSPAWSAEDPDDHEVKDWLDPERWQ